MVSLRHGPRRSMLKTIGGITSERGFTFAERMEATNNSEQENASSDPRGKKAASWKEDHETAQDSELRLERSGSDDGSEDDGPSRRDMNITKTKFGVKADEKTRKQSPIEDSEDSSKSKRRKISADASNPAAKGAPRPRAPLGSSKKMSALPKETKTYGSRNKSKPGFGSSFSSSASSQRDKVKQRPSGKAASAVADSFEMPPLSPKTAVKSRAMEHFPDDDEISSPNRVAKFEMHESPVKDEKDKYAKPRDEFIDHSDITSEEEKPKTSKSRIKVRKKKHQKERTPPPPAAFIDFNDDVDFKEQVEKADLDNFDFPATQLGSKFIDPSELLPSEDEDEKEDAASKESPCPWCSKPVPTETLTSFSEGKRLNVRQQQKFCRQHNKQTAEDLYAARHYPDIDWSSLPERIENLAPSLLPVIDNTAPSHYRARLSEKIAAGKDRAMKSGEDIQPGYYGPRGFNMMCEILVQMWGKLLKQKAVEDRVISGRGSAYFIQSVLVAELATRLVSEDMGVGLEEARRILEESREVGEMLHEDE